MKKISCFLFACLFCNALFAQMQVQNQLSRVEGNYLVVEYDLVGNAAAKAKICIEIFTTTGKRISAPTLSGDVGSGIKVGKGKRVLWSFVKDNYNEEGGINVNILSEEQVSVSAAQLPKQLGLSLLLPGLGMSKKNRPLWLLGTVAYGSLAMSYLQNQQARNRYTSYLAETNDGSQRLQFFEESQQAKSRSQTFAYVAGGIWAANMLATLVGGIPKKPKSKLQCSLFPTHIGLYYQL